MTRVSAQNGLIDNAMEDIPSVDEMMEKAFQKILKKYKDKKTLKKNFGQAVIELEATAYQIYLNEERNAYKRLLRLWMKTHPNQFKKINSTNDLEKLLQAISPYIRRFEFRAGQMRKARAGRTFEKSVYHLLTALGKKCEFPKGEAKKKLKRIDLVVPNTKVAIKTPDKAFFLSCKHTLRERWKQTIPERKPSWRVFLLTTDDELPENKANEINQLGMMVYVKDSVKSKSSLRDKRWVRRLSDLPKDIK